MVDLVIAEIELPRPVADWRDAMRARAFSARAAFTVELAARAFSLIDSYIYGFGRQSLNFASGDGGGTQAASAFLQALSTEAFPYLAEMAAMYAADPGYDEAADFSFGLNLILDALQQVLASTQS